MNIIMLGDYAREKKKHFLEVRGVKTATHLKPLLYFY